MDRIGSLTDQLLARVVPKTRASASYCSWHYRWPDGTVCLRRSCCNGTSWCSPWRTCP
jgi:hypothetical protein